MIVQDIQVVVQQAFRKMKLAENVPVTPEFREEIDLWMLEFFGATELIKDGEIIYDKLHNVIIVNARTYEKLRAATIEV